MGELDSYATRRRWAIQREHMNRTPVLSRGFAIAGGVLLVVGAILLGLHSFAWFHVASLGMVLIATAVASGVIHRVFPPGAAALSLTGIGLVVFGLLVMPLNAGVTFAGWVLIVASAVLALRRSA
jgi:hypothetical protein